MQKNPFIFITVFTIFILVDWSASVNEKPRQKCLSQAALILPLIKAVTAAQIINFISHPVIPAAHQKAFTPPRTVNRSGRSPVSVCPVILKP